jgi:aminodeoxyfutalosine synthase
MPATDQELTSLANSHDIISLGVLADEVRRRLHGTKTTFVRVATVAAEVGAPVAHAPAAGELRIVGAPRSGTAAVARVREVAASASGTVVTGFSLPDLERLSVQEGVTLRALLEDLRGAGLELVADAAVDLLQDARRSIEEVNIAGLALARLTLDQSTSNDAMPLLKAVVDLQRSVAVLRAFAPLPRRINPAAPTTGYDDVKRIAMARIVVDNVPSIQVDWALYGPKLAQVALTVGADDVDAVSPDGAAAEGLRRAPLEEIRRNIRAAGLEPVERNGRFDALTR